MCGILGAYSFFKKDQINNFKDTLNLLNHRGPNDCGFEKIKIEQKSLLLGHKRLSIIDLSEGGHQPMAFQNKEFVITYNGEIYNYIELREELKSFGYTFQTNSDTEVLLKSWVQWGKECLKKLNGMYAFCIYNKLDNTLNIARDPFGIKPIYFYFVDNFFCFSSEIIPILNLIPDKIKANGRSAYRYLVHNSNDFTEETFFENVNQLLPGYLLKFNLEKEVIEKQKWWEPKTIKIKTKSKKELKEIIKEKFLENLKFNCRSDVRIGIPLSGGIDSSSIACGLRHLFPDMDIHTFTYKAKDQSFNESKWADKVNKFIGAVSHEILISPNSLINDLNNLINAQGEPFVSTSVYAGYCVYKNINESDIVVSLDGQGADELLGGYQGYVGQRILSMLESRQYLKLIKFLINWKNLRNSSYLYPIIDFARIVLPDKIYNLFSNLYGRNTSPNWINKSFLKDNYENIKFKEERYLRKDSFKTKRVTEALINAITGRGLRALLRYGDRNSMISSVESRFPFLESDFANFMFSLPEENLIDLNGKTKSIFKEAMKGIVPEEILNRNDKIGFETPQNELIRENNLIFRKSIKSWEINDPLVNKNILKRFDYLIKTKQDDMELWRMINYAIWHNKFIK